jgi:hypothetical protein
VLVDPTQFQSLTDKLQEIASRSQYGNTLVCAVLLVMGFLLFFVAFKAMRRD